MRDAQQPTTAAATVEIVAWSGCPSHDAAADQLQRVLDELGRPDVAVETSWVESEDEAIARQFVGSPSYRFDGQELLPGDESPFGLGCRLYIKRDGHFSPLPDDLDVRDALTALLPSP